MPRSSSAFAALVAVILAAMIIVMWKFWPAKVAKAPVTTTTNASVNTNVPVTTGSIAFSTADVPDRDPAFDFRFTMPDTWAAQYLADPKAIIFYQPLAKQTALDSVQVTVRLATIVPTEKADHTSIIDDQTVYWFRRSDPSAPSTLPAWEKQTHWEAWIPSTLEGQYFVVAQAPALGDTIFAGVVSSFHLSQVIPTTNTHLQ